MHKIEILVNNMTPEQEEEADKILLEAMEKIAKLVSPENVTGVMFKIEEAKEIK